MIKWIANLFRRSPACYTTAASVAVPPKDCHFTLEGLKKDLETRFWQYGYLKPILSGKEDRLLNWLGSADCSGYTREKCLRWLIDHYTPGDENRILLRLTDWVPQVQSLAQTWTITHFPELPFNEIAANADILQYLLRKDKLAGDTAIRVINATLLEKAQACSRDEFLSLPTRFRRHLYFLSLARGQELRNRIIDDPDPFNRLTLLNPEFALSLSSDEISSLQTDSSTMVRRHLLRWRVEHGPAPSQDDFRATLVDANRGLRELSRYWAKELYGIDAYAFYHSQTGLAHFYIADYARPEDVDFFCEGARHRDRQIRFLCLHALCLIDYQRLRSLDLKALLTDDRRIRRLLRGYIPRILDIDEIRSLRSVFLDPPRHSPIAFLGLVLAKSYWNFIDAALFELSIDPSPTLVDFVRATITQRATIYEKPTAEMRHRIRGMIQRVRLSDIHGFKDACALLEFTLTSS